MLFLRNVIQMLLMEVSFVGFCIEFQVVFQLFFQTDICWGLLCARPSEDRRQNKLQYLSSGNLHSIGIKKVCTWIEHRLVKLNGLNYAYLAPSWNATKMRVKKWIINSRMGRIQQGKSFLDDRKSKKGGKTDSKCL
jgi:hypothetical protein